MSSPTQVPPQQRPPSPPTYPPSETVQVYPEVPRRRPVWPWVLGSVLATAVLFLAVGVGGVFWLAGQQPKLADANVVYQESFDHGPGRFPEFTQAQTGTHAARAQGGSYLVTSSSRESSSSATATVPAADVVDVSAVTTLTKGSAQGGGTGLIVARGTSSGYLFQVVPAAGARLARVTGDEVETVASADVSVVASTARLRFTVEPGLTETSLVGYLDGQQVVSAKVTDEWTGFDEVGVVLYTGSAPAAMTVDDVVVKTAAALGGG